MTTKAQAGHTPGNWEIRETPESSYQDWIIEGCAPGKGNTRIATVDFQKYPETAEANARLIAAAPEMLEALKEIVHMIETDDSVDVIQLAEVADAVIRKAEGL